jgi:Chaperone of endosialidase
MRKLFSSLAFAACFGSLILSTQTVFAQGTAFTYQGQLQNNGGPANGLYDMTFNLYETNSGGSAVAGPDTIAAVGVTNGEFTVEIEFYEVWLNASTYWLDIQVRPSGTGAFTELAPRQQVTPTPYAVYSEWANNAEHVPANSIGTINLNTTTSPNLGQVLVVDAGGLLGWTNLPAGGGGGGSNAWSLTGNAGTSPGANFLGTTDAEPLQLRVGGNLELLLDTSGNVVGGYQQSVTGVSYATVAGGYVNSIANSYATIGGGTGNHANGEGSFIGGGGYDGTNYQGNEALGAAASIGGGVGNEATGTGGVVGGGYDNAAEGDGSFVGGGYDNYASGAGAVVGGGGFDGYLYSGNSASSEAATVSGGLNNNANGPFGTVPGGLDNTATGIGSFAAGSRATATGTGTFVWGDGSRAAADQGNQTFNVLATGGIYFFNNATNNNAVYLAANATSWSTLSDRNAKKDFQPLDCQAVLDKLNAVPIQAWHYKWEDAGDTPNLGPMAQNFKHTFYPGRDDKSITTLEFDGVELAAIQGLNQKLEVEKRTKDAEIQGLKRELAEQKTINQRMEARFGELEKAVARLASQSGTNLVVNDDIKAPQ